MSAFDPRLELFSIVPRPQALELLRTIVGETSDTNLSVHTKVQRNALAGRLFYQRYRRLGQLQDIEDAIRHQRVAVSLTDASDTNFGIRYTNLGASLLVRLQSTRSLAHIQESIDLNNTARSVVDEDDLDSFMGIFQNLASTYYVRFDVTERVEDIDESISNRQLCIQLAAPGHERLPYWRDILAVSLSRRFELTTDTADLDGAIDVFNTAMDETPFGHPFTPHLLYNLSITYARRSEFYGTSSNFVDGRDDLQTAISTRMKAISLARGRLDPKEMASWIGSTGILFTKLFKHTKNLGNLDEAIKLQRESVDLLFASSSAQSDLPKTLANLAATYFDKYQHSSDAVDLTGAITEQGRSIQASSASSGRGDNDAQVVLGLLRLGMWYCERAERHNGGVPDFDRAAAAQRRAIRATPAESSEHAQYVMQLGNILLARFRTTGEMGDINEAVAAHLRALELALVFGAGAEPLSSFRTNLGNSLARRFERTGEMKNIDDAIVEQRKARDGAPDTAGAPKAALLTNLGLSLTLRFERIGAQEDLDEALGSHRRAVELFDLTHDPSNKSSTKSRIAKLNNLAIVLLRKFETRGRLEDIEEAILIQESVVKLTPRDDPDLPARLNNLGKYLAAQYQRSDDISNLNRAIASQEEAVKLTPEGHPDLPNWLNALGGSLLERCLSRSDLVDKGVLDRAVETLQRAADIIPKTHVSYASCLMNLGSALFQRAEASGSADDLLEATSNMEKVISTLRADDHRVPEAYRVLGNIQARHFMSEGDMHLLQSAISNLREAVARTPQTHSRRTKYLQDLGKSLERLSSIQKDHPTRVKVVAESLACFKEGALAPTGAPSIKLHNAILWAIGTLIPVEPGLPSNSRESLEAFDCVVSLFPVVAGLDKTPERRHQVISEYPNLVSAAVAVAIECGELEKALYWMEQGRCLLWNQVNELRSPLDELRAHDPALADRVQFVSASLEHLNSRTSTSSPEFPHQDETYRHVKLANEWNELLDVVRGIPGFNDFLRTPSVSYLLKHIPEDGPVVVINVDATRSDALVLFGGSSPDHLLHIPLPDSTYFDSENRSQGLKNALLSMGVRERGLELDPGSLGSMDECARGARLVPRSKKAENEVREILKGLWSDIVERVFENLALTPSDDPTARIWWCPTGPLTFLPIHAAGIYDGTSSTSNHLAYAIPSYTPNVSSLVESAKRTRETHLAQGILVVSEPGAPGLTRIPGTTKEAQAIDTLAKACGIQSTVLEGREATVAASVSLSDRHRFVHLACHASQNAFEPLKSAFHLHDGRLELSTLIKRNHRTSGTLDLAFLSACQTSTGDKRLSEEAVHLAAGMMAAGYGGVVATMWSIQDKYAPEIAEEFYRYLFDERHRDGGKVDSRKAAAALAHAVRGISRRLGNSQAALAAWVPYVHFGI